MNHYRTTFTARCPVNDKSIQYTLEIVSRDTVYVEALQKVIKRLTKYAVYHEALADELARALPGHQVMCAHHHGVDIATVRGQP